MRRFSKHLTFANVVSCLALSIALGGTSYAAITIPRNSVGANQIRPSAVGTSELRASAIRGSDIRNRTIGTSKLSDSAREKLRGSTGPAGPIGPAGPASVTLRANVSGSGTLAYPTNGSVGVGGPGNGTLVIDFGRPISACTTVATLARVGDTEPPAGRVAVSHAGNEVTVRTYDTAGNLAEAGFNLIVAC